MPYYIYIVTSHDMATTRSAKLVREYENFKFAKTEVRRLRNEEQLEEKQTYKIIFANTGNSNGFIN